MEFFLLIYNFD